MEIDSDNDKNEHNKDKKTSHVLINTTWYKWLFMRLMRANANFPSNLEPQLERTFFETCERILHTTTLFYGSSWGWDRLWLHGIVRGSRGVAKGGPGGPGTPQSNATKNY